MSPAKTLTKADRLTIVKLLATGKDPDFVAQATGHDRETVLNVGASHGYPDTDKLAWAADVLEGQVGEEIPEARHTTAADLTRPTPASRPTPPARTAPAAGATDEARALIAKGKKSTRARTRTLADRAEKALGLLAKEVREETERNRAAAARAAEEARIRSEVARLEAELAAKKALLPKSRAAKGSPARTAGADPKTIRAWARANGVDCPAAGRVPRRVVDAYTAAHTRAA